MAWNKDILAKLNEVATVQNHPNDDQGKSFEDYPIWVVTNDDKVYLVRAKKVNGINLELRMAEALN